MDGLRQTYASICLGLLKVGLTLCPALTYGRGLAPRGVYDFCSERETVKGSKSVSLSTLYKYYILNLRKNQILKGEGEGEGEGLSHLRYQPVLYS